MMQLREELPGWYTDGQKILNDVAEMADQFDAKANDTFVEGVAEVYGIDLNSVLGIELAEPSV